MAEKVLERISEKGVPLKKANNNYWSKKYIKFTEAKKLDTQLDFQKFAQMDYKELYNEAIGQLKTKNAKEGFNAMKRLSNYNTSSKILDVKKGPLLGKFCQEYKG